MAETTIVPCGKTVLGTLLIPTPGGPIEVTVEMESDGLTVDVDRAMDESLRAMANVSRATLRKNWRAGQDAQGRPLPPLSEATRKRREARSFRRTKSGRERPVKDTTTPMYETGMTQSLLRVAKQGEAYDVSTWLFGGAVEKYGDEALMDYPTPAEPEVNKAIEKALAKAIK